MVPQPRGRWAPNQDDPPDPRLAATFRGPAGSATPVPLGGDGFVTRQVLFVCTGNSCRSQMAEAIVNHDLRGEWRAFSAGTRPAGFVDPRAKAALEEIGVAHDGRSKSIEAFRQDSFDLVITVCDQAAEACPTWIGGYPTIHIGFPDPARATGSGAAVMDAFRSVRDDIRHRVVETLRAFPDG